MHWRVSLLGEIRVTCGALEVTHFESSRVVALLARLALFPERIHPREELIDLLWPDVALDVGRHRLRTALSSLRKQLEPLGNTSEQALFLTDRHALRLNPQAFVCDARELEQALRQKRWHEARSLYKGELLPGFYDDWIIAERERLEALFETLPESAVSPRSTPLLPSYLSTFFGRETERAALVALLQESRLITLTGPGGIGKTRFSVEVARPIAPTFERCAFVPLAECFEPGGLAERVRGALGLQSGVDLTEALAEQKTLLVLDNFEQLLESGGAVFVATLLSRLPLLTCLVTSRRTLGLEGERELALAPLPLATEAEPESAALALFLDRARVVQPHLALTESTHDDLRALGKLLEGVPLAIELATSRLRALSLAELRQQLGTHFSQLTRSGPRSHSDERHRSLQATVEWSWRLLTPRLQHFLAALSVFRGGWSAAAAAMVCGCDEPEARELLEELVADSLVVVAENKESPAGPLRFHLLEMIRSFVQTHLTGEQLGALTEAHGAFFLHWSRGCGYQWHLLSQEAANLQTALERAVATGNTERALALLKPTRLLWELQGGAEENLPLLRRALALPGGSEALHGEALIEAGSLLLTVAGDRDEARGYLEEAEARARGNPGLEAAVLRSQIHLEWVRFGESPEAQKRLEHALGLARAAGAQETEASLLNLSGILALRRERDFAAAERAYAQAQALFEELGDALHANYTLFNRANAALEAGNTLTALEHYGRCRQVCQSLGDSMLEVDVVNSTGAVLSSLARWDEAQAHFLAAIQQAWALGYRYMLGHALWNLAEPLAKLGQAEQAAPLLGFTEHFWTANFSALTADDRAYLERVRLCCAEQLGDPQTALLWGQGSALSLREAVFLAQGKVSPRLEPTRLCSFLTSAPSLRQGG